MSLTSIFTLVRNQSSESNMNNQNKNEANKGREDNGGNNEDEGGGDQINENDTSVEELEGGTEECDGGEGDESKEEDTNSKNDNNKGSNDEESDAGDSSDNPYADNNTVSTEFEPDDNLSWMIQNKKEFPSFTALMNAVYQMQTVEKNYKLSRSGSLSFDKQKTYKLGIKTGKKNKKIVFARKRDFFGMWSPQNPPLKGCFYCVAKNDKKNPCPFVLNFSYVPPTNWTKRTKPEKIKYTLSVNKNKTIKHNHGYEIISKPQWIDFEKEYGVPQEFCVPCDDEEDDSATVDTAIDKGKGSTQQANKGSTQGTVEELGEQGSKGSTQEHNTGPSQQAEKCFTVGRRVSEPPPRPIPPEPIEKDYTQYNPKGIKNTEDGNYCFINTALQMLFNNPIAKVALDGLSDFLKTNNPDIGQSLNFQIVHELIPIYNKMVDTDTLILPEPETLLGLVAQKCNFIVGEQNDAMETYDCLLDMLDTYYDFIFRKQPLVDSEKVKFVDTIECDKCKTKTVQNDTTTFMTINSPLETMNPCKLDTAIQRSYKYENRQCHTCNIDDACKHTTQILEHPKILKVYFNRYRQGQTVSERDNFTVSFPRIWVPNNGIFKGEHVYRLVTVVYHSEDEDKYHYTADLMNWKTQKWMHCDDDKVEPIEPANAPGLSFQTYLSKSKGRKNPAPAGSTRIAGNIALLVYFNQAAFNNFSF